MANKRHGLRVESPRPQWPPRPRSVYASGARDLSRDGSAGKRSLGWRRTRPYALLRFARNSGGKSSDVDRGRSKDAKKTVWSDSNCGRLYRGAERATDTRTGRSSAGLRRERAVVFSFKTQSERVSKPSYILPSTLWRRFYTRTECA